MKKMRLVVYDGEEGWIDATLRVSLKLGDNVLSPRGKITIIDVTENPVWNAEYSLIDCEKDNSWE